MDGAWSHESPWNDVVAEISSDALRKRKDTVSNIGARKTETIYASTSRHGAHLNRLGSAGHLG